MGKKISRREFIKSTGLASVSIFLSGCQSLIKSGKKTVMPITSQASSTVSTVEIPSATVSPLIKQSETPSFQTIVALANQRNYQESELKETLIRMLSDIGGITDIVKPGSHVGIKLNLTGGTWWDTPDKPPATEYFVSHPAVASVLAELLLDAGASKITMMDGLGDKTNFVKWGYQNVADRLDIELIDLCEPAPFASFSRYSVGDNYLVYPEFLLHPILNEVDVFISMAKLKVHATAGVTLSMKNLIGIAPITAYRNNVNDNNRSAFHGNSQFDERLPKVIIDLNKVRPIDLAIIDGIYTAEGGAGPWDSNMRQIKPEILIAGKDALAVDTIGTMCMGFDPEMPAGKSPFNGGLNHLLLASGADFGCMDINKIQVVGESVSNLSVKYLPATT
ncbi:MAG: DUF362 domain-containing protein [Anaerolineaceae bacterium]|nr:DUF362 domain-containing protein [Anaerolineaceae bacterium]